MNEVELLNLIDAYGNACFDCGEWQLDKEAAVSYEILYDVQQAARLALVEAVQALLKSDSAY